MILHNFTLFFLKKIQAQEYMSDDEYANVCYTVESFLINITKTFQVYLLATILGVAKETFFMHLPYMLLRRYAGGWHAKTSLSCSMFSIFVFVGIPLSITGFSQPLSPIINFSMAAISLWIVWRYAPADTEKNPLFDKRERDIRRFKSIAIVMLILATAFIVNNSFVQSLILIGLFIESIMINPLFYKLMRRSYQNYEKNPA
ncbi:accessory gene regulator AgrB [Enterococcus sp.]|uniref:accessory gene regulator AgrB n=1 Tax=Enterococcus sp. TaxID=35783 RepID=UPI0028A0731A|nr:accessory gene regulator AgrB [Enterococcus sp.]